MLLGVYVSLGNRIESGRWVAECIQIKTRAVHEKKPRVIILAGSNGLFGFSARRLSDVWGIESVNGSVHGGLGIGYMFHYGRRYFSPNRIFVLPLEYHLYGTPSYDHQAFHDHVIGFDPQYFIDASPSLQFRIISNMSLATRIRQVRAVIAPEPEKEDARYQSRSLNAWGDETSHNIKTRTPEQLARVQASPPAQFRHDDLAWEELSSFVSDAKAVGSQVVIAYPNIYYKVLGGTRNEAFLIELKRRAANIGIPVVGKPEESVFGDERAYDTSYHQNTAGQIISTDRLFHDLVKTGVLQRPTAVAIATLCCKPSSSY
jgi:hypothetical protein